MSADNYAAVLRNFNDLKTRQAMLGSQIDKLSTESGQEEEIRSKFSVAKPGEAVVMVIDGTNSASVDPSNTNTGLWQKFLGLFR